MSAGILTQPKSVRTNTIPEFGGAGLRRKRTTAPE
jgi:hypothetical protein